MTEIKLDKKHTQSLKKRSLSMIIFLVLQYIFGMYINMFAATPDQPEFKTEGMFPKIIFGLHGLLGLSLLIGSTVILIKGLKSDNQKIKKISIYGFLGILLAFFAGICTVVLKDTAAEVSSYVMSLGFIVSLITYGKIYYSLKEE